MNFLQRRRGLLDAVVFSGGEPTLQRGLQQAITEVRELGFKVGLHTNGAYPLQLGKLLPLSSWVGMDIKTEFSDYEKVTGTPSSAEKVRESAKLLIARGVPYEFRTTVHPHYHSANSLLTMAHELQQLGARHYILQEFRPQGCSDASLNTSGTNQDLLNASLLKQIGAMFDSFSVRHA